MNKPRLLRADEIETRVGTDKNGKGLSLLLYKTARTDMDILDETFGAENWSDDYKEIKGNLYCGICVNGVWKWDCGTESNTEAEKGEASDAFKRAGFRWGIGRELYSAPFIWVSEADVERMGNGKPKSKYSVKTIEYNDARKIVKLEIVNDATKKVVYSMGEKTSATKKTEPKKENPTVNPPVKCEKCGIDITNPPAEWGNGWIERSKQNCAGHVFCKTCAQKYIAEQKGE